MRAAWMACLAPFLLLPFACGGDNTQVTGQDDGGTDDGTIADSATGGQDTAPPPDTGSGVDTGTLGDASGGDAAKDGGGDAGLDGGPLNGCSAGKYANRENGGQGNRTIGVTTQGGNNVYDVPCMSIKKGQSVVWNMTPSTLAAHPLAPFGGDTPTPITVTNTGTQITFAFPNAGVYGFHSQLDATMLGAIEVQ
jgi:plastocyanin